MPPYCTIKMHDFAEPPPRPESSGRAPAWSSSVKPSPSTPTPPTCRSRRRVSCGFMAWFSFVSEHLADHLPPREGDRPPLGVVDLGIGLHPQTVEDGGEQVLGQHQAVLGVAADAVRGAVD